MSNFRQIGIVGAAAAVIGGVVYGMWRYLTASSPQQSSKTSRKPPSLAGTEGQSVHNRAPDVPNAKAVAVAEGKTQQVTEAPNGKQVGSPTAVAAADATKGEMQQVMVHRVTVTEMEHNRASQEVQNVKVTETVRVTESSKTTRKPPSQEGRLVAEMEGQPISKQATDMQYVKAAAAVGEMQQVTEAQNLKETAAPVVEETEQIRVQRVIVAEKQQSMASSNIRVTETVTVTEVKPMDKQVLVLGLDGAGKTSLLHCLTNNTVRRSAVPTQGFNAVCISTDNNKMDFLEIGGSESLRAYWKKYLSRAMVLIYVVDAADQDRFQLAKTYLHDLIQEDSTLPVFVLANKQDIAGASGIADIHDALNLSEVGDDRKLYVIGTCVAEDGSEIGSSMEDIRELIAQVLHEAADHVKVENEISVDLGTAASKLSQQPEQPVLRQRQQGSKKVGELAPVPKPS